LEVTHRFASPRVIGPLSECSGSVRVEGQLTGSTVTVFADGTVVGTGTTSWPDKTFSLSAFLIAGQQVTATQTVGLDTSPASPEAVEVQAKPPFVGAVGFRSHLNQCGECVWIEGLVPGAKVELRDGGTVLGAGESYDGNARFHLPTPLSSGMDIKAQQSACGTPGTVTDGLPVDLIVEKLQTLPTPVVQTPLRECERRVTVSNVVHGATVTLMRSAGPNLEACFDLDSLWMGVNPPLALGETVSARQELRARCKLKSADAAPVMVEDNTPVPVSNVLPPLCAGNTTVVLSGLIMGARVTILADGAELGLAESPVDGGCDFLVPALVGGTSITAIQELCGEWSVPGTGVLVNKAPASLPTPKLHEPLFECGAAVRVSNLHVGARVYVYSSMLGAPIGERTANALYQHISPLSKPVIVQEFLGRWFQVGGNAAAEILAVHAALLHTNKIVYFGGDQHTSSLNRSGDVDHTRLFDCTTYAITAVTGLPGNGDLFCAGHAGTSLCRPQGLRHPVRLRRDAVLAAYRVWPAYVAPCRASDQINSAVPAAYGSLQPSN